MSESPVLSQYSDHTFLQGASNNSWSNIFQLIPDNLRVLDVGCSTGSFGAALEQFKHCEVTGIDISEADIAVARTRLSDARVLDITAEDALSLGKFDVVVFADVLEHLVDPRSTLRAVHGLLNEGGIVVYSIPHMGHVSVRLDLLEGRFPYSELGLLDRTHLHYYDRGEVNDIFASAGYRISQEAPVVSEYPRQWLNRRLEGLGLSANEVFFDMLNNTESQVFQYVGVAIPQGAAPAEPSPPREYIMPPDEILDYARVILAENEALRTQLERFRNVPVIALMRRIRRKIRRK